MTTAAPTALEGVLHKLESIAPALNDGVRERDRDAVFPRAGWQLCAEAGLLRLTVPQGDGGLGLGAQEAIEVMQRLGELCEDAGLVFALNSLLWSCIMPVARFGSEEQREELLPGLCNGSLIAANAMTEPTSGSDAFSLQTIAQPVDGGYLITGEKLLISNAPIADLFVVYARSEDRPSPFGISAFLVDADTPGVRRGPALTTMGLRTAPMGSISLKECHVARSQLLGSLGAGMAVFSGAMSWERGCAFATAVGVMERQLKRCVARANSRQQFGSPIASYQAIAHRLADMRVRISASRLLISDWAAAEDDGRDAAVKASIAKLFTSEALIASSLSAFEIFGGYGYLADYPCERELRDALAGRIYGGSSEMQRNLIATQLGVG